MTPISLAMAASANAAAARSASPSRTAAPTAPGMRTPFQIAMSTFMRGPYPDMLRTKETYPQVSAQHSASPSHVFAPTPFTFVQHTCWTEND